jgi:hypothetical protein
MPDKRNYEPPEPLRQFRPDIFLPQVLRLISQAQSGLVDQTFSSYTDSGRTLNSGEEIEQCGGIASQ